MFLHFCLFTAGWRPFWQIHILPSFRRHGMQLTRYCYWYLFCIWLIRVVSKNSLVRGLDTIIQHCVWILRPSLVVCACISRLKKTVKVKF